MTVVPWEHLCVINCDDLAQERKHQIIKRVFQSYYKRRYHLEFTDITDNTDDRYLLTTRMIKNNEKYERYWPIHSTAVSLDKLCPTLFQGENIGIFKTMDNLIRKRPCFEYLIIDARIAVLILKVFANGNIPFYIPNEKSIRTNNINNVLIPNFDKYAPLISNGNIHELSKYDDSLLIIMHYIERNSHNYQYDRHDFEYLFKLYPDDYNEFITNLDQMKSWFEEQLDFFIKYIDAKTVVFIPEIFGQIGDRLYKARNVFIFNNSIILRIQRGISSDLLRITCQELGFDIKTVYTLYTNRLVINEYE